MIIISCSDLLDSWGSNLLSLWPSGHGLFDMLNFTSVQYRSAKLDWPEHTMSITINWPQWVENAHTGLVQLPNRGNTFNVLTGSFHNQPSTLPPVNMSSLISYIHAGPRPPSSTCILCSLWGLYRSVTCCTALWVNAALLRSPPWSQFAPSRQSVLSPECAVLSGVSSTALRLLLRSSTPLGIY